MKSTLSPNLRIDLNQNIERPWLFGSAVSVHSLKPMAQAVIQAAKDWIRNPKGNAIRRLPKWKLEISEARRIVADVAEGCLK